MRTHKAPHIICSRRQFQILLVFQKLTNMAWYFMKIVCWQTILMKYHTIFLSKTRKDVAKFVVCWFRVKSHLPWGGSWLSGRLLDSGLRVSGFELHWRYCLVSLCKTLFCLVLGQSRKIHPDMTDKLLTQESKPPTHHCIHVKLYLTCQSFYIVQWTILTHSFYKKKLLCLKS